MEIILSIFILYNTNIIQIEIKIGKKLAKYCINFKLSTKFIPNINFKS